MNDFVNYLNSLTTVDGNSTGTTTEAQVKGRQNTRYYDAVKVDRNLGRYITQCITDNKHCAFILTGHAGDGKTSILVQVLKALHRLDPEEGLKAEKEYEDFFYVKDMSEISAEHQVVVLRKALEMPTQGKTSLLISNTGPLLKTFNQLMEEEHAKKGIPYSSEDRAKLQSTLLSQLDENDDSVLKIDGFSFVLVNIARVDNVPFAVKILKNILAPQLWSDCAKCSCADRCPIKHNRDMVFAQFDRVAAFVENFYRYLYEHDKRMTIRQMVGQISYALTGNLTCTEIKTRNLREPLFRYSFANLFFGYKGLKPAKDAIQIKGIQQIRNLALDRIALDVDYQLFVKQDYSCFLPTIQEEINGLLTKSRKHYRIISEEQLGSEIKNDTAMDIRCAIRRIYLMFSLVEEESEMNRILNQIFGASYTDYLKMILCKQSKHELSKLRNIIFEALYLKNTGFLANGKTELPLTLRREDDVFQSVMIVLGEVEKSRLTVIQKSTTSRFEDIDSKKQLYLKLNGDIFEEFLLSLPLVTYFTNLIAGAISSNNNPALTHGIAQLDAKLLEVFREDDPECEEDCELAVVINTTGGQIIERFSFDGNRLYIQ